MGKQSAQPTKKPHKNCVLTQYSKYNGQQTYVNVKLFLFSNMLYITLGFLFDQGIYINVKHEAMFTFVKSLIDK